jgi:hypothetical protein
MSPQPLLMLLNRPQRVKTVTLFTRGKTVIKGPLQPPQALHASSASSTLKGVKTVTSSHLF